MEVEQEKDSRIRAIASTFGSYTVILAKVTHEQYTHLLKQGLRAPLHHDTALLELQQVCYQEVLAAMDGAPMDDGKYGMKSLLQGERLFVNGDITGLLGECVFDRTGKLKPGRGPAERTVFVSPGGSPLMLVVRSDDDVGYRDLPRYVLTSAPNFETVTAILAKTEVRLLKR